MTRALEEGDRFFQASFVAATCLQGVEVVGVEAKSAMTRRHLEELSGPERHGLVQQPDLFQVLDRCRSPWPCLGPAGRGRVSHNCGCPIDQNAGME